MKGRLSDRESVRGREREKEMARSLPASLKASLGQANSGVRRLPGLVFEWRAQLPTASPDVLAERSDNKRNAGNQTGTPILDARVPSSSSTHCAKSAPQLFWETSGSHPGQSLWAGSHAATRGRETHHTRCDFIYSQATLTLQSNCAPSYCLLPLT